jgi:hypothetical protein
MPCAIRSFEDTPNPHALKCAIDPAPPPLEGATRRSYATADEAQQAGDAFALALFAIDGVERVMVLPTFVTVNKSAGTSWSKLKPALKKAVGGFG